MRPHPPTGLLRHTDDPHLLGPLGAYLLQVTAAVVGAAAQLDRGGQGRRRGHGAVPGGLRARCPREQVRQEGHRRGHWGGGTRGHSIAALGVSHLAAARANGAPLPAKPFGSTHWNPGCSHAHGLETSRRKMGVKLCRIAGNGPGSPGFCCIATHLTLRSVPPKCIMVKQAYKVCLPSHRALPGARTPARRSGAPSRMPH